MNSRQRRLAAIRGEVPAETPDDVFRAFCEAPASYAAERESK